MDSKKFDFTGPIHDLKKNIHRNNQIGVTAPSKWIQQMAIQSGVFLKSPELIPYGVDTANLKPLEKKVARSILGLPNDKHIVSFVATFVDDPRKGFKHALEAVRRLNAKKGESVLLAIGHPRSYSTNEDLLGVDCRFVGFVSDMRLLGQYLASSDVFLFPTVHDNLPLVVLESMAVETPTVAYRTGGVPEMVVHNQTGYLADQNDVDGLVKGLQEAFYTNKGRQWGLEARKRAEHLYSFKSYANAHLEFYQLLIRRHKIRTGTN
jgi:glycosyltransferase involved in cell wall biosynthesis